MLAVKERERSFTLRVSLKVLRESKYIVDVNVGVEEEE